MYIFKIIYSIYNKKFFLIGFLLCLLLLLPYLISFFYIHPFFDDYILADHINEKGRLGFFLFFYNNWSGRYFDLALLSLYNGKIEGGNTSYIIFAFTILISLYFSFYYLVTSFFGEILSIFKRLFSALFLLAFCIVFMPEIFSAFYWHCSSFYLLELCFVLCLLGLLIEYAKGKKSTYRKTLIILLNISVAGLSEIFIFTIPFVYGYILFHIYYYKKKIHRFFAGLIILFIIASLFNIIAPGNFSRINASGSTSFLFSSYRALYDLIIFHFYYASFKTPFILLLILYIPFIPIVRNTKLNAIFNCNPFATISISIFILYLHHALSLYGAGYSMQGRVLNFSIILFYILVFYNLHVVSNYTFSRGPANPILLKTGLIRGCIIWLIFMMNFSDNNRKLWGDLFREFPAYHKQMNNRYTTIYHAKSMKQKEAWIQPMRADPKILHFGAEFNSSNYLNKGKYLSEMERYFEIPVKCDTIKFK